MLIIIGYRKVIRFLKKRLIIDQGKDKLIKKSYALWEIYGRKFNQFLKSKRVKMINKDV